ncbi:hypothetical protein [Xylophilus ampelinus]|uniref:hypothetical protein n=1 Tax=Xylophilus ampelinus TaxID=54067 RepID=UPI0011B4F9DB|nr:hypothetical protein [Xylophilus ampelinus]MCS4511109.1 hypothetical protein [Xylophilus ampelinus]
MAFSIGTTWGYFDHIDFMRLGTFGLAAIAILFLMLYIQFSNIAAPKRLAVIGDASFSLYLIHPYLLDKMGRIRYKYFSESSELTLVLYSMIFPLLIIAFSIIWFKLIEKPLMSFALKSNKNYPMHDWPTKI